MTGIDHPSTNPGTPPPIPSPPRCPHTVDNGQGITWWCVRPPHPEETAADSHYMVRDELAVRRNG